MVAAYEEHLKMIKTLHEKKRMAYHRVMHNFYTAASFVFLFPNYDLSDPIHSGLVSSSAHGLSTMELINTIQWDAMAE